MVFCYVNFICVTVWSARKPINYHFLWSPNTEVIFYFVFCSFCQLVFEMEGFDVKLEGMFSGQVIPLLSVDGSIQGELRNWSSAVSHVRIYH